MKSNRENKNAEESKHSYHSTMKYLNFKMKKYDTSHENFVVPWQMAGKGEKEFNF